MPGVAFIQDLAVILIVAAAAGWLCRRSGLSPVVGYLAAGALVGPHTPPLTLVAGSERVAAAAQLGLVFLMFSIGLRLSWRRIRRLGFSLLLGTIGGAVMMYYVGRLLGAAMGWTTIESVFFASMLMVSSSTIVGRLVQDSEAMHERAGQLAAGFSLLEAVVAVVMLTVLNSWVHLDNAARPEIGSTLARLGGFIALAAVLGLLLLPWLLRRLGRVASEDLQTLGTAGLLLGGAAVAYQAGYSLALGPFLLGAVVADTPHRAQVERTFDTLRDVFAPVFFVAIGMQVDLRDIGGAWWLVLGISLLTIVARVGTSAVALALTGTPVRDALRAGFILTPIGEFSFIIAQLGLAAAVLRASFYPLVIGIALVTGAVAPWLTRRSAKLADRLLRYQRPWVLDWLQVYHAWLRRLHFRGRLEKLWKVSRKRFWQIGIEVLFVTGLLLFSQQLLGAVQNWLGTDWLFPNGPEVIFWVALSLVVLAPVVAIWRNLSALALVYTQVLTARGERAVSARPLLETALKAVGGGALFFWLAAVLPAEGTARMLLLASAVVALLGLLLLRRRLVYWHSRLEVELQTAVEISDVSEGGGMTEWIEEHGTWRLHIAECTVPDLAECRGQAIAELGVRQRFGCSVVGIDRQGFFISLPEATTVLYPRDRLLLLGTRRQVRAGKEFLLRTSGTAPSLDGIEAVRMETMMVAADSPVVGLSLAALRLARRHGVQIAGIHRGRLRTLNPPATEVLTAGDELLALGTAEQLDEFRTALAPLALEDGK
ncbi:cation:proton antiporter [Horticoccus luteus]|uniref:Cation:proton antiporter n=1 Tax=Horticoccus luteus TaxID=2862869 RepID=A0A8F9TR63_9BACT|nr:cation:proton antiporter [Horticoccus luteus]QYM77490.1 cation:proton antiporter [Horticoccus luteus]